MKKVQDSRPQKNHFTLTVERLAGLGDGMGLHEGRKVFVPYTLAGDVVQVRMLRRTTDADYAELETIMTPSPERVAPVCRHFGRCGGCSLQHVSRSVYTAFKQGIAQAAVRKAGYDPAAVAPVIGFPVASRRRVELKVKEGKLGYFAPQSHALVAVEECPVLEPDLEALVKQLAAYAAGWQGGATIQINGLDEGFDLLLTGSEEPLWPFDAMQSVQRASFATREGNRLLFQRGEAFITFGGVKVRPPAGAFLQAVKDAQDTLTQQVQQGVAGATSILDLFCGLGTYSFPLCRSAKVTAVEGDAAMVKAMQDTAAQAGLSSAITALQRDLFASPLPPEMLRQYDAVVINPPRTGAAAQCAALAQARVSHLVMVSCNPATFARDAKLLREGGYSLQSLTPIDQFCYTPHLELVAKFSI